MKRPTNDGADDAPQSDREVVPIRVDKKVDRELEFHVEMRMRELIARGVAPDTAREQARAAFGDIAQVSAELNRIGRATEGARRRTQFLVETIQDARFALRIIARRRATASLTIGVLALGIGATTAIFSVADGVLLRPLPFAAPDRLAAVWIAQPALARNPVLASYADATPMGNEEYQALRANATAFQDIGLWTGATATLNTDAGAEQVGTAEVTGSILRTLRVVPALGRGFAGEDVLGGAPVVLLSWETWRSRYGGDSSIVGRSVMLGNLPHTVIGVLPPGVRLDRTSEPPAFWLPALRDSSDLPQRHNRNYRAIARLASGATFDGAAKQAGRVLREVTHDTTLQARVELWQRDQGRGVAGPLMILLGAGGLLLAIACVNVAILQLGEVGARRREIAARVALGAGTGRLVRQLLGESMVLALVASVLGSGLAWAMLRGLVAIAPERLPGMDTVHIDARVLAFALACSALTGLVFGIVPALVGGRGDTTALVRAGAGQSAGGMRALQRTLIATQLSLSMVLLVVGTLFAQSLRNIGEVDPGFDPNNLTAIRVNIPYRYTDAQVRTTVADVKRRIEALPGVSRVTVTSSAPFLYGTSSSPVALDPAIAGDRAPQHTMQSYVAPGYFEAMGIRLLAGRTFQADDDAGGELVTVVNASEVARDFDGVPPLGQRIRHQGQWRRIVGVVADVKNKALSRSDGAGIYVPFDQHPNSGAAFLVRGSAQRLTQPVLRALLYEIDPRAVVQRIAPMRTQIERSYGTERYRTILVSVFGVMAMLLAAIGLYGVSTRAAARRMREMGIRMALGGTSRRVARLLVGDAMSGVLYGIAIGVPAAIITGRALRKYLFGIAPDDPMSLALVALVLASATLIASALPARRAGRASPAVVLRSD